MESTGVYAHTQSQAAHPHTGTESGSQTERKNLKNTQKDKQKCTFYKLKCSMGINIIFDSIFTELENKTLLPKWTVI